MPKKGGKHEKSGYLLTFDDGLFSTSEDNSLHFLSFFGLKVYVFCHFFEPFDYFHGIFPCKDFFMQTKEPTPVLCKYFSHQRLNYNIIRVLAFYPKWHTQQDVSCQGALFFAKFAVIALCKSPTFHFSANIIQKYISICNYIFI